jgi:RNA-binding motif protein, X-linked 2
MHAHPAPLSMSLLRYGEVMDVNLVRDKETGKSKGFAFLMYEDQRSTVLAVDNLNGAQVLNRTLRVDHVKDYKQKKVKNEDGELVDPEEQSLNAKPEMIVGAYLSKRNDIVSQLRHYPDDASSESSVSSGPEIDPEDPMYEYLVAQRREEKAKKKAKKAKSKSGRKDETPEERRARKERKRAKKARKQIGKSDALKGVEDMLKQLNRRDPGRSQEDEAGEQFRHRSRSRDWNARMHSRSGSRSPRRTYARRNSHSRTPPRREVRERMHPDDREERSRRYDERDRR